MPVLLICILSLAGASPGPAPEPAPAWSPDGSWLAFATTSPSPADTIGDDWLFDRAGPLAPRAGTVPAGQPARLWAVQAATGEAVLLDESSLALTAPCWKADGSALAVGRLVPREEGKSRFEIVVQDAADHRRVVHGWDLGPADMALRDRLRGAVVAWSSDSRHLVGPAPDAAGLVVLQTDTGAVLKTLAGASPPAWSPDGSRLAFFQQDGLYWLDTHFAEPNRLAAVNPPASVPAPVWSRDGQSILFLERGIVRVPEPQRPFGVERADLVRIRLAQAANHERVWAFLQGPLVGSDPLVAASFALDPDGGQLFFSTVTQLDHNQIAWCFPRERVIKSRFNPLDDSVPIWSLSVAPSGGTRLGLRVGLLGPCRAGRPLRSALAGVHAPDPGPGQPRLVGKAHSRDHPGRGARTARNRGQRHPGRARHAVAASFRACLADVSAAAVAAPGPHRPPALRPPSGRAGAGTGSSGALRPGPAGLRVPGPRPRPAPGELPGRSDGARSRRAVDDGPGGPPPASGTSCADRAGPGRAGAHPRHHRVSPHVASRGHRAHRRHAPGFSARAGGGVRHGLAGDARPQCHRDSSGGRRGAGRAGPRPSPRRPAPARPGTRASCSGAAASSSAVCSPAAACQWEPEPEARVAPGNAAAARAADPVSRPEGVYEKVFSLSRRPSRPLRIPDSGFQIAESGAAGRDGRRDKERPLPTLFIHPFRKTLSAQFIPEGWQPLAGGQRSATTGQDKTRTREETGSEGVAAWIEAVRTATPPGSRSRNQHLLENPGCAARTGANGCHPSGMRKTDISFLRCDTSQPLPICPQPSGVPPNPRKNPQGLDRPFGSRYHRGRGSDPDLPHRGRSVAPCADERTATTDRRAVGPG